MSKSKQTISTTVAGPRSDRAATVDRAVCVVGVRTSGCYLAPPATAGGHRDRVGSCKLCHRSRVTGAVTVGAGNGVAWRVRGRIWPSQAWASGAGRGSRRARSQSTVPLMPSVRSVSGFQPSTRVARVESNALA